MDTTKKTLITKLSTDVTDMFPKQVEAIKALHQATFESQFAHVAFELQYSNEECRVLTLLENEAEITAQEKSDGISEFLSQVGALYDDEEEIVHDEE